MDNPPTTTKSKIFCIGLNKTGTTSIGDALQLMGYNRLGWDPKISPYLTMRWHEGYLDNFVQVSKRHDVFEDIPWCFVYKQMDELYPDAKFILTVRKDTSTWHDSILKHIERRKNWLGHFLIYGSYSPRMDAEKYVCRYETHNREARDYFAARPGKLLELCFETGDGWAELCPFLGCEKIPEAAFPHSNINPEKKPG